MILIRILIIGALAFLPWAATEPLFATADQPWYAHMARWIVVGFVAMMVWTETEGM